ncbi:MAG: hypothetical protein SP1CHLAM54_18080 [Chlamydiia bacterium]|nr:hypothetical protein [Chlamydiia bacterium]MCH9616694.1 hypothetical protein [Chlamydiia bacterium]MCH9629425.1 hypothetical protein [Chlamydiia bacterium]
MIPYVFTPPRCCSGFAEWAGGMIRGAFLRTPEERLGDAFVSSDAKSRAIFDATIPDDSRPNKAAVLASVTRLEDTIDVPLGDRTITVTYSVTTTNFPDVVDTTGERMHYHGWASGAVRRHEHTNAQLYALLKTLWAKEGKPHNVHILQVSLYNFQDGYQPRTMKELGVLVHNTFVALSTHFGHQLDSLQLTSFGATMLLAGGVLPPVTVLDRAFTSTDKVALTAVPCHKRPCMICLADKGGWRESVEDSVTGQAKDGKLRGKEVVVLEVENDHHFAGTSGFGAEMGEAIAAPKNGGIYTGVKLTGNLFDTHANAVHSDPLDRLTADREMGSTSFPMTMHTSGLKALVDNVLMRTFAEAKV